MPGIHLICDLKGGDLRRDHRAVANAMDSLTLTGKSVLERCQ